MWSPLGREVNRVEGRVPVEREPTSTHFRHPSLRAERTPEAVAVSGICGESGESVKTLPDFPQTNLIQASTAVIAPTISPPSESTRQSVGLYYLDYEATSPSTLKPQAQKPYGRMCGCLALLGQDEDENRIAKRLFCGREWCPDCGVFVHRRRIARVLPRLLQLDWMAYLVITFPLEVRVFERNPKLLSLQAKRVRKLLRRLGYRKIYTRWHFFGEHGEKYHPHLNVLFDGGWLSPEELARLKNLIRRTLLPRSMAKLIKKDLVIWYDSTQESKRKMHWIKYVTKASFLDRSWDDRLAEALYGFHNGCFAGTWNDPPKWKLTGTDKKFNALLPLAEGKHPVSGKPIVWCKRPIPFVGVLMEEPVDLGSGYYLLPSIRPPPLCQVRPTNLTELPAGDYRKHPNHIRKEIDRHRELISRRQDYESCS